MRFYSTRHAPLHFQNQPGKRQSFLCVIGHARIQKYLLDVLFSGRPIVRGFLFPTSAFVAWIYFQNAVSATPSFALQGLLYFARPRRALPS